MAGNKARPISQDVRGFTREALRGNWDLVSSNISVFAIQDAIKFPDLIHAHEAGADRAFPQAQAAQYLLDTISLTPESMNMVMWIMSDRTIPRSFRFMEEFSVPHLPPHQLEGRTGFVKFHWKPKLGLQSVAWNRSGQDQRCRSISIGVISGLRSSQFPDGNCGAAFRRTSPTVSILATSQSTKSSPRR